MQLSADNVFRAHLFMLGCLAGLSAYIIAEFLPNITDNQRLVLFIGAFAYAGFLPPLLLAGSMSWRKVLAYVIPLATLSSMLLLWASFRYEEIGKTFDEITPILAFAKLVVLPLPFFIAHETAQNGWQNYPVLFQRAWGLFVKAFTACVFVGVFWGVMWTSAFLLDLVGLDFLEKLIEEELVWMSLSGGIFGLGLAVLHEMEGVVDTLRNLVVRLLRLLLPIIAIVSAIFLAFVPIRGLEDVFGNLSAAGTILWMAVIAVALITASLDATDEKGTQNSILLWSARTLAVLLPVMAGIAVYALYLRVNQYGWTPSRLLAVIGACVMLGYAAAYAIAVVIKVGAWRASIRQANVYMALALIGLSILWLTPALDAQRISANAQVKRYFAGKADAHNLPLWELNSEWGWAGKAALEKLKAHSDAGKDAELATRLEKLAATNSKYVFNRNLVERSRQVQANELQKMVTILPVGTRNTGKFFETFSDWELERQLENCKTDGACILLVDDFFTLGDGLEAMFFHGNEYGKRLINIKFIAVNSKKSNVGSRQIYLKDITAGTWPELRAKLLAGEYQLVPSGIMSLEVGNERIEPIQR